MPRTVSLHHRYFVYCGCRADSVGVARLERIQEYVATISGLAWKPRSDAEDPLASLSESFTSLLSFKEEYRTMALDEVVVAAIAQTVSCRKTWQIVAKLTVQMKQDFADWDPLDISSDSLLLALKRWRDAYNLRRSESDESKALVASTGPTNGTFAAQVERVMTPWESLLWTLWLPRVRSSIK